MYGTVSPLWDHYYMITGYEWHIRPVFIVKVIPYVMCILELNVKTIWTEIINKFVNNKLVYFNILNPNEKAQLTLN